MGTHERRPRVKVDRVVSLGCNQRGDVDRGTEEVVDAATLSALALRTLRLALAGYVARRTKTWRLTLVQELLGNRRYLWHALPHVALLIQLLKTRVGGAADQQTLLVVPWRAARGREGSVALVRMALLLLLFICLLADRRHVSRRALHSLVVAAVEVGHKLELARAVPIAAAHSRCLDGGRIGRIESRRMHGLTLLYITVLLVDLKSGQGPRNIINTSITSSVVRVARIAIAAHLGSPFASWRAPRRRAIDRTSRVLTSSKVGLLVGVSAVVVVFLVCVCRAWTLCAGVGDAWSSLPAYLQRSRTFQATRQPPHASVALWVVEGLVPTNAASARGPRRRRRNMGKSTGVVGRKR